MTMGIAQQFRKLLVYCLLAIICRYIGRHIAPIGFPFLVGFLFVYPTLARYAQD